MGGFPLPFDANTSMVPIPKTSCWSTWIAGGFTFNSHWFLSDCCEIDRETQQTDLISNIWFEKPWWKRTIFYTLELWNPMAPMDTGLFWTASSSPFIARSPRPQVGSPGSSTSVPTRLGLKLHFPSQNGQISSKKNTQKKTRCPASSKSKEYHKTKLTNLPEFPVNLNHIISPLAQPLAQHIPRIPKGRPTHPSPPWCSSAGTTAMAVGGVKRSSVESNWKRPKSCTGSR